MKKTFIIITIGIIIIVGLITVCSFNLGSDNREKNLYPLSTIVWKVNEGNNKVTVMDFNGNLWQFNGIEDWEVGDVASLIMDSKNTDTIFDDEIVKAQYNGFIEGHWGK